MRNYEIHTKLIILVSDNYVISGHFGEFPSYFREYCFRVYFGIPITQPTNFSTYSEITKSDLPKTLPAESLTCTSHLPAGLSLKVT